MQTKMKNVSPGAIFTVETKLGGKAEFIAIEPQGKYNAINVTSNFKLCNIELDSPVFVLGTVGIK